MAIFVTGGAGFIGSQFVRDWVARYPSQPIINFDNLTYAGNLENLASVAGHPAYSMVKGDITDPEAVRAALPQGCDAIVHFAAESHVDRSILSAGEFVRTNVLGTQVLLDIAREKARPAIPAHLDRRGRRQHPARQLLPRRLAAHAEQSLRRQQGRGGAPGPRRGAHLRPGRHRHPHQQQLRPLSVPREAHPAGHQQRAARQARPGVRRRPAGA